jgi:hypothetical protein
MQKEMQSPKIIERLRRYLPLTAYPRSALRDFLRFRGFTSRDVQRLTIVDIFDGGVEYGIMCRFVTNPADPSLNFVAPIAHLSLDRRHPLVQVRAAMSRPRRMLVTRDNALHSHPL